MLDFIGIFLTMKINQPILFLILLFYTSLNAQKIDDTTSQQSGKMLPESKATVPEKGNYGVNALKEYKFDYNGVYKENYPPSTFEYNNQMFAVSAFYKNFTDSELLIGQKSYAV